MRRTVFFLSDSTGITAETLGHALLTQFDNLDYRQVTVPFVREVARAEEVLEQIEAAHREDGVKPIVFSTLPDPVVAKKITEANALVIDLLSAFLHTLEGELNRGSSHATGRFHGLVDRKSYEVRIEAVDFALKHDDGATTTGYPDADIILVGVSRSGKTPTSLYLSMQHGVRAANYPLIEDDIDSARLPKVLRDHGARLFGLTISPQRLRDIRAQRRPDSRYASLAQCRKEVSQVESLFKRARVPYIDTSTISIEEIATSILHQTGIERRVFA